MDLWTLSVCVYFARSFARARLMLNGSERAANAFKEVLIARSLAKWGNSRRFQRRDQRTPGHERGLFAEKAHFMRANECLVLNQDALFQGNKEISLF